MHFVAIVSHFHFSFRLITHTKLSHTLWASTVCLTIVFFLLLTSHISMSIQQSRNNTYCSEIYCQFPLCNTQDTQFLSAFLFDKNKKHRIDAQIILHYLYIYWDNWTEKRGQWHQVLSEVIIYISLQRKFISFNERIFMFYNKKKVHRVRISWPWNCFFV